MAAYIHITSQWSDKFLNKNLVGLQTPSSLKFSAGSLAERRVSDAATHKLRFSDCGGESILHL
jgi:hypothetical protein